MKYTIIITIYNKEKFLEKAIISACSQNYKDYTVIVVNDGSTDNSEKLILKLKEQYNFEYYKKKNTGIADTRNYAIKKVKTPYFLFLDADDYLEKDLLQEIDKYSDYDILNFSVVEKDNKNNIIKYHKRPNINTTGDKYLKILVKNKSLFTVVCGYVFNKEYIINNNFEYPKNCILEDFYLTPFLIASANKITSIDYIGYNYIENSCSITHSKDNKEILTKTYLKHYDNMLINIKKSKYNNKLKKTLIGFISSVIIWYGCNLDKCKREEYIKEVKKRKIYNNLNNNIVIKLIIIVLYKLNIYYQIRIIIKRGKEILWKN